jgi:hypothetical protein
MRGEHSSIRKMRNVHKILVGNVNKNSLKRPSLEVSIILKRTIDKCGVRLRTGFCLSRIVPSGLM